MTVVLVTTNLARGGAEIQVTQLAGSLHRRGWNVTVISLLPLGELADELAALEIPVFSLGMRAGKADVRAVVRLIRILNKVKPQIVHAHMFHANLLARCVRLICPIPVVLSSIHSMAESSRKSRSVRGRDWVYRITDWLSDVTVCVSREVAERHGAAHAISAKRLRVIPNAVDTDRFKPNGAERAAMRNKLGVREGFTWLAVGRLIWKKDYATMLEASAKRRAGVLLIAGEGPLETELRARAIDLGIDVRFLGLRQDIPDLMNACDGLLLSSVVEGLPVVLLEAAASGLPSIATAVGGVCDAVVDRRTGYVVPPSNPTALAEAMTELIELTPEARKEMSRAAREHAVGHFDLDTVAGRWEQLYAELLAGLDTHGCD
ncbi:MAG: glycosyltransferase [Acidobacteriota bacterium]|nr:glycosyltransferase [Acidobacteriota bacterium]